MNLKPQMAAFSVLIALAACNRNQQMSEQHKPDMPVNARESYERNKTPALVMTNSLATNKSEFVASMQQRLKDLDGKVGELAQKSESYKDEAKAQADKAVAALREQREQANLKFEEVKKASAEAWEEVRAGFASAMVELEKAYEDARSKFK